MPADKLRLAVVDGPIGKATRDISARELKDEPLEAIRGDLFAGDVILGLDEGKHSWYEAGRVKKKKPSAN